MDSASCSSSPQGDAISVTSGATPRAHRLAINGLILNVLEWAGDLTLPPLLLLHGGMAHAHWWAPLVQALDGRLRAFAPDRRGHGESDWADTEQYGIRRDLEDTEAIAADLGLERCVVVGHSQGGLLAVLLALEGRLPCAGLALVDTPFDPASPSLRATGERLRRIPQINFPNLQAATRRFQPWPPQHRIPATVLSGLADRSFRPATDGGFTSRFDWRVMRAPSGETPHPFLDFPKKFTALHLPVLAVRAGDSTILDVDDHARMLERLPKGRGLVIPETTHSLHVERPDLLAEGLVAFVKELSNPPVGATDRAEA